jgi:UDP-N-acetylmuramate dehydrogenase
VFPREDGTAKLAAAWLIEHCGWKGCREGGIGVHPDHALVLVNYGEGTGEQVLALAARIGASVRGVFGLELVIEPRVYGGSR